MKKFFFTFLLFSIMFSLPAVGLNDSVTHYLELDLSDSSITNIGFSENLIYPDSGLMHLQNSHHSTIMDYDPKTNIASAVFYLYWFLNSSENIEIRLTGTKFRTSNAEDFDIHWSAELVPVGDTLHDSPNEVTSHDDDLHYYTIKSYAKGTGSSFGVMEIRLQTEELGNVIRGKEYKAEIKASISVI